MGNYIYTRNYPKIKYSEYKSSKKTYFLLGNKVIDATNFIELHPGGKACLLKHNKHDIKKDYKFHSKKAQNLMKSMIVYELDKLY